MILWKLIIMSFVEVNNSEFYGSYKVNYRINKGIHDRKISYTKTKFLYIVIDFKPNF